MFALDVESKPTNEGYKGEIKINDFREPTFIPSTYWKINDYRNQWKEAIQRVLTDARVAALITEMYDPNNPQYALMCWPMYREDNKIFIRNSWIPYNQLSDPFTADEVYAQFSLKDRDNKGDIVSEWEISINDLTEFLAQLP